MALAAAALDVALFPGLINRVGGIEDMPSSAMGRMRSTLLGANAAAFDYTLAGFASSPAILMDASILWSELVAFLAVGFGSGQFSSSSGGRAVPLPALKILLQRYGFQVEGVAAVSVRANLFDVVDLKPLGNGANEVFVNQAVKALHLAFVTDNRIAALGELAGV